jgi:hypothetical protein
MDTVEQAWDLLNDDIMGKIPDPQAIPFSA